MIFVVHLIIGNIFIFIGNAMKIYQYFFVHNLIFSNVTDLLVTQGKFINKFINEIFIFSDENFLIL